MTHRRGSSQHEPPSGRQPDARPERRRSRVASRLPKLAPGTRVRLRAVAAPVELTADTGTVIRPDEFDGYYVVRLDHPAIYREAAGQTRPLSEISQDAENLDILIESR